VVLCHFRPIQSDVSVSHATRQRLLSMMPSSPQSPLLTRMPWLKEPLTEPWKCAHTIDHMTAFKRWNTERRQPLTDLHHV
jgi:hypothetical protein